jgi:hypothetical protein
MDIIVEKLQVRGGAIVKREPCGHKHKSLKAAQRCASKGIASVWIGEDWRKVLGLEPVDPGLRLQFVGFVSVDGKPYSQHVSETIVDTTFNAKAVAIYPEHPDWRRL